MLELHLLLNNNITISIRICKHAQISGVRSRDLGHSM